MSGLSRNIITKFILLATRLRSIRVDAPRGPRAPGVAMGVTLGATSPIQSSEEQRPTPLQEGDLRREHSTGPQAVQSFMAS